MSLYFKTVKEKKEKKEAIKILWDLIEEDDEKIKNYTKIKNRIVENKKYFSLTKRGQLKFFEQSYYINMILKEIYFNSLIPQIYYLWSKQKRKNPNFTLFVGSTFEYNNNTNSKHCILFKLDGNDNTRVFKTIEDYKQKIFNQFFNDRIPQLDIKQNFFIFSYCWTRQHEFIIFPSVFDELEKIKEQQKRFLDQIHSLRLYPLNKKFMYFEKTREEEENEEEGRFNEDDLDAFYSINYDWIRSGRYIILYSRQEIEGIKRIENLFPIYDSEEENEENEDIITEKSFKLNVCVICLNENIKPCVLFCDCGHMCICENCDILLKKNNICPVCRVKNKIKRKFLN